jgi:hypothetical protein
MQLYSVSLADIEDHLVEYFAKHYGDDPSVLTPATDVRKMYNFKPGAWAELADALSKLPWMVHLGVVLVQNDMRTVSTLEQIAYLIFKRMQHVISPSKPVQVTPLATLMRLSGQGSSLSSDKAANKATSSGRSPTNRASTKTRINKGK